MPNGDDKNWTRTCVTIDGFRARYGCWPKRVRFSTICFADLVGHVLKPEGFALVSTVVELAFDDNLQYGMTAESNDGSSFEYGKSDERHFNFSIEQPASQYFGSAILRDSLECGLESVALWDAEGNPVNENAVRMSKANSAPRKKVSAKQPKLRRRKSTE